MILRNYENLFSSLYDGKNSTKIKNINYKANNVSKYKEKPTSEVYGALGYLASINLFKKQKQTLNNF